MRAISVERMPGCSAIAIMIDCSVIDRGVSSSRASARPRRVIATRERSTLMLWS